MADLAFAQGVNPVTPQSNDLIEITKPAFANPSNFYTTPTLLGKQVTPVTNPPTTNAYGPGIMQGSGVPQGTGSCSLYAGCTALSTSYGKFITGIDSSGNLLSRSLTTLSQSLDGRSLPGFPGGDLPPFMLFPYYAGVAADSAGGGTPTFYFANMAAANNQKYWFMVGANTGNFLIGAQADAWIGNSGVSPQYAFQLQRNNYIPTGATFTVPVAMSTAPAYGQFTSNGTLPANNSTLTFNGTVVTFVMGAPSGNQVQIAGTVPDTLSNLVAFLKASVDAQISLCGYSDDFAAILTATYKTLGTTGNSFTIAASSSPASNFTVSAGTLTGGGGNALTVTGNQTINGGGSITVAGQSTFSGGLISTAASNFFGSLQLQSSSSPFLQWRNLNAPTNQKYFMSTVDTNGLFHFQNGTDGAVFYDVFTSTNLSGSAAAGAFTLLSATFNVPNAVGGTATKYVCADSSGNWFAQSGAC